MQEDRFADPRWSVYYHEFACTQGEVEINEHVHLLVAAAVLLGDARELQYWRHWITAVSARRQRCTPFLLGDDNGRLTHPCRDMRRTLDDNLRIGPCRK
jgi:hypothetical protein